jgi:mannose-6-phosphate isomerase-like protein (cupin superfamily)
MCEKEEGCEAEERKIRIVRNIMLLGRKGKSHYFVNFGIGRLKFASFRRRTLAGI